MKAVLQTIRILAIIQLIEKARCQDGFNNGDILRYQQMASNDGQIETITGYNTNIIQRDPSSQSISSVSTQFHVTDNGNKNEEYNRADRGRSRKVYRIKNPFQHQIEDSEIQAESTESRDSGTGASNQYAAMQFSLPPEEFLQQMRAENQYLQQQQSSTPAPSIGYTVTPQPQYQYSTISPSNYDNSNQQSNQIQLEPKSTHSQAYIPGSNYQYSSSKIYSFDNAQSTPSPINTYVSTPLPNNQFVVTPSNSYVSSSSPIFLSSPQNLQNYVSSPLSPIQISTSDYNNRGSSTIGSLNYENNDINKKMQLGHYDNSVNGIRYSINGQQHHNDYPSSTPSSLSSPFSNSIQNVWQNTVNSGANAKSLQELSLTQYQNYPYSNNQQDPKSDEISNNNNGETHYVGSLPSANNIYMSFVQPDSQSISNLKIRNRDTAQETGHPEVYSNGDYGWKLTEQKPQTNHDNKYASINYPGFPGLGFQSDGGAASQMNFQMDASKPYNNDQTSKSSSEIVQSQEFAKAAAKAHENFKQQQQQQLLGNNYASYSFGSNFQTPNGNVLYGNNDKQINRYTDGSNSNLYSFSNTQGDLITASPYYYVNSKENSVDSKSRQPFDHAKALKNIVPIDVSNVVSNTNAQMKSLSGFESTNRYNVQNYGKDQADQNLKQNYRPVTESYYKDKNTIYGFNLKTKPEDFFTLDNLKQLNQNDQYQGKSQQSQVSHFNPFSYSGASQSLGYTPQLSGQYQDNVQIPANIQQQSSQRPDNQIPSDIASILKLNDLPYRIAHGASSESFSLHNNDFDQANSPTPLPIKINQNLGSHQLDVTTNFLNKLILNNQNGLNKPGVDSISTINGFKVANPYNLDLSLVAEMLRGKSTIDETHILSLRDQYNKPAPLKLDISQLQLLLRNEKNSGNLSPSSDGLSSLSSPYLDGFNNGRFPYQGVKYSRSQEEEESIVPIAETTNTHPIGAVMEQDDTASEREVSTGSDTTAQDDESITDLFDEDRTKKPFSSGHRTIRDKHRHPNALLSGRQNYHRKYPKTHFGEPYPLLKPPPSHGSRTRDNHVKLESFNRRRRINKPKAFRILKSEHLYEADSDTENDTAMPIVLRPPPPVAEAKSDSVDTEQSS